MSVTAPTSELSTTGDWAIDLELPMPPSVNDYLPKLGNRSPVVRAWIKQADMHFILQTRRQRPQPILGHFEAHLMWSDTSKCDFDNPIKPLMDYLERLKLIRNDRMCRRGLVEYGHPGDTCRVRLREWKA
jgi:Holliday junction resolvase RusA-like endonuclease